MTATYELASKEADRRARRRQILDELAVREERDRRVQMMADELRGRDVWVELRIVIEGFERGDDDLHGFPRATVDFSALYASFAR